MVLAVGGVAMAAPPRKGKEPAARKESPPAESPPSESPPSESPPSESPPPESPPSDGKEPREEERSPCPSEGAPSPGDEEPEKEPAETAPGDDETGDKEPADKEPADKEPADKEPAEAPGDDGAGKESPPADEGEPAKPAAAPVVQWRGLRFMGGDVPRIGGAIDATRAGVARCVAEHGGLSGDEGVIRVQLLVRARGRAEGVEVLEAKELGRAAARCVRDHLRGRRMGTPSQDPVGVSFRYQLAPKR
jgi:hypothetical protein